MKKKKAKYSEVDERGALFVDCSECTRGGNGTDENKCSNGWRIKKGNKGGCSSGILLNCLEIKK